MREALAVARAALRARIDKDPVLKSARDRRRRRRALLLAAALLLLALLSRCECVCASPPAPDGPADEVAEVRPARVAAKQRPLPRRAPTRFQGVAPTARPRFAGERVLPPTWLDDLRLQVAARSPRLAHCFAGAAVPGALRWSTAVNPKTGEVSDSTLEGVAKDTALTTSQRNCLLETLTAQHYRLPPDPADTDDEPLASRVSILIEF